MIKPGGAHGQKIRRHPPVGGWARGSRFRNFTVYLSGTCNAPRARARAAPRRARLGRRAAPGVGRRRLGARRRLGRRGAHLVALGLVAEGHQAVGLLGARAAARLTGDSRSTAAPRARCGNLAIAQRRATRQLEGNQRRRSSLIGREVGGWAPVAGTKNRGCCLVLFGGAPPAPPLLYVSGRHSNLANLCSLTSSLSTPTNSPAPRQALPACCSFGAS